MRTTRAPHDLHTRLDQRESEIRRLNAVLERQQGELVELQSQADGASATTGMMLSSGTDASGMLPPNAKPGECYARVLIPPTYKTVTERVMVEEGTERIEVIPPKYELVEEKVLVKEATERIEVVPAEYEMREEQMVVKPASTHVVEVPAEYVWTEEKVLVRPAQQVWKKGRGPIEQVDNGTGEIMCLVEVPAEYKSVKKRVLKTPATTRRMDVPAEYATVMKKVMVKPETTRRIAIPAEYKTVTVNKLAQPEQRRVIPIEPKYETVARQVVEGGGSVGWRRVLCETNLSGDVVTQIQEALKVGGYDPGIADGVIGPQTQAAIQAFQSQNNLAVGGLTFETLKALGVAVSLASN
jgi:hypothetical protein